MCIPREELADLESSSGVARTHEDHVSETALDELEAAQNEGTQQNLAQFCVFGHKRSQRFVAEFQKIAGLGNPPSYEASLAGNHRDLAREFARTIMCCNSALTMHVPLHNLHASRKPHEERHIVIAELKQDFAPFHLRSEE